MDPESGSKRPIIFFRRTDFPEPDAPIMAKDSPSSRLKLMFSNITLLPNVFFKFLTFKMVFFVLFLFIFLSKKQSSYYVSTS